jgi:hypothetical protein
MLYSYNLRLFDNKVGNLLELCGVYLLGPAPLLVGHALLQEVHCTSYTLSHLGPHWYKYI